MAGEGIKAGDAYVQATLRMAPDAFAKLAAEQSANANKAGDRIGDRIGKAIAKRIASGVKDGLTAGGVGVGAQGAKQGEDFGGKFAEVVKTRVEAALKSLPRADISLGTADADAKLRDLRTRLEELSGKTVGVDISAAGALAEIRDIKAKLDELGAKSPSIQVKTDTAAAAAALAAIQAQVNALNGKNAKVGVSTNADAEAQKVFTLANAIILLGPAAIPSAAAAVGAILGIGAAATAVFAAIGVGKLAFQGVGGALTAIDNAQQQASKSGATLAQQQNQLASGADSVKSAEASLANARASAAAGLRSANQQIGSSEQSLADAERAELRAQQDLTLARQDAKRSIEDLNTQVADGALQQRQAALDLDKARIALAAVNAAGSGASADQRAQAQLTYDQAVQQVTDLSIRQQRAIQDRDAANKAGVDGSKQVKAAQESLLSANEKVGNAEQAVSNARIAAADASRQAAFSIAQAQQSVVSSQRAMQQAIVSTSTTGGAATDALRVALSKLSPEGQKFAYFLYGLKPQLDQLKQSAQAGIFPGLQAGITTVLPYFGQLDRFVASVAGELGHLGQEAAHTFTDPFWKQFFGFIGSQAVPNLELMYRSIVNVAEGGARIVQAFGPVEQQVGGIILGLTQKFLTFSQGLDHNTGFQNFIRYVETETPHVISTLEALGTAGLHIIQAYAPVGSVVVSEIRLLATVINAIPVPVITALAFAFTAYKTSALLAGVAQQVFNSSLITGIGKMVTFNTVTSTAGVTTNAFQRATQGAAGFLGGGVWGLAIGGAVLAISYFAGEAQKAKQRTDDLKSSLTQFTAAYKDGVTPAANANAAALVANNSGLQGLLDVTNKAGLSTATLVDGLNGNTDARRKVVQAIDDQQQAELLAASNARNGSDADNVASKAHRDRANALGVLHNAFISNTESSAQALDIQKQLDAEQHNAVSQLKAIQAAYTTTNASVGQYAAAIDAVGNFEADATTKGAAFAQLAEKIGTSTLTAADKASLFSQELTAIGQSTTTNGPVFDALGSTFESIARASLDAHDKVNLLSQALKNMYQPSIDLNEANEALVRTQADFKTQIGQSSAGFDLNTKASGANQSAILQNRDALEAALQATRDKYVQDLASEIAETDARKTHDATVKSILDGIPTRQRDTQAVKDLVTEYGAVPKHVNTDVTTPGLADAIDQLAKAHAVQAAIGPPVQDSAWIQNEYQYLITKLSGAPSQVLFHAEGGSIHGPGTGTSDSIPAMLSDGEHVWTAAEVQAAGGHGQVEALRQAALDRQIPRFAGGGAVTWPINYDLDGLDQSATATLAGLQAQYAAASKAVAASGAVGDLGIARTIYGVAQTLKADHKVLLSAYETALVESGMRNLLKATDHDSLGVFQQRPSQGWGTPAQVTDVAYAAHAYLTRAIANEPSHAKGTAGQLAQSVQRSAFPDRYDQRQAAAEAIIAAVSGGNLGSAVGNAISGVTGKGGAFPPWPASPAAQRGDSGVWRQVVALINSTGPISGTFGNAYRAGDPLWHGCVPLETKVFTQRGWITHDQIVIGEDETIGYNPETGKNEWTRIVDIHRYEDVELWTLRNRWVELEVTPGHKWLVDQQVSVQTETVCTECGREFETGRGMTTHRGHVHKVFVSGATRHEEQLVETRNFKQSTRIHLAKPANLGSELPISDDEAELIGWVFADGYMERYGPTIVQSRPAEVAYLKKFMAQFPHSVYRRPPEGHQTLEVFRFGLAWEYWQDLADRSKASSKADAMTFVLNLSQSQRAAFLRGFIAADGHRDPRTQNDRLGYSASQVSGPMAEAIKMAAYLEGYRPDVNVRTEFDDGHFGSQPIESIGFRTAYVKSRNLPVVAKRQAAVWCPTTTLGTWTARQGEEIFLTGNSGRAVDWMGFNQDPLATFLSGQRPLELIHRSNKRDYAYTRGVDKGSFNPALMEAHRNHVHIAMAQGGAVLAEQLGVPHRVFDNGGLLMPGLTLADNRTGAPELIQTPAQTAGNGPTSFNVILEASDPAVRELMSLIDVRVEAGHDRVASAVGSGVRD